MIACSNTFRNPNYMSFIRRFLETRLRFALLEDSVIYLTGPRGSGKKSLYLSLKEQFPYITFEDRGKLAAAKINPTGFVKSIPAKTIIDHATLAMDIFKPMGLYIDDLRRVNNGYVAGQFLLTGVSNILSVPCLSKNLTGKLKVLTLLPFAAAEIIEDGDINFIYDLFTKKYHLRNSQNSTNILDIIKNATFSAITYGNQTDPKSWYRKYIDQLLIDIKSLNDIVDKKNVKAMIMLLLKQCGKTLNIEQLSKELDITIELTQDYLSILENFYFLIPIEPFDNNSIQKIYVMDTNLIINLLNHEFIEDYMFKNFVASELYKHIEYLDKYPYKLFSGEKVDFIVKNMNNETIVAINVKYSDQVTEDDFKDLKKLKKSLGKNFVKGVMLYLGNEKISFDEDLLAMPISSMWGAN